MLKNTLFLTMFSLATISNSLFAMDPAPTPSEPVPFRNWQFNVSPSCFNTSLTNCYPGGYEDSEGNINWVANIVAAMNIAAPVWNVGWYLAGGSLIKKWQKEISNDVIAALKRFETIEKELRVDLASIIKNYNNGIGEEDDELITIALIELLNLDGCSDCIEEFAQVVSNQPKKNSARDANRHDFRKIGRKWQQEKKCSNDKHCKIKPVVCPKDATHYASLKTWQEKAWDIFFKQWDNASHLTTWIYCSSALALPLSLAWVVDIRNRAGALIGDYANISNYSCIPTCYPVTLFQQWMSKDRNKQDKMAEEIAKRFVAIGGIIEIAGQVIGKMGNGINASQARGLLKALMIVDWPAQLVSKFKDIAANRANATTMNQFIVDLNTAFEDAEIKYLDNDIKAALELMFMGDVNVDGKKSAGLVSSDESDQESGEQLKPISTELKVRFDGESSEDAVDGGAENENRDPTQLS